MTKFEQVGVNYQMEAVSIEDARKSFSWSCKCCCNRGMKINCDRCAISQAHLQTIALMNDTHKSNSLKKKS